MTIWIPVVATVLCTLIIVGSQWRIHRHSERNKEVADLRESLYQFQHLVAEYWGVDHDAVARRTMEQRMTTEQSVIQSRFYRLAGRTRRLNRAYQSTSSARLKLFDAATGGAFQQVSGWEPDQSRIVIARQAIEEITRALP